MAVIYEIHMPTGHTVLWQFPKGAAVRDDFFNTMRGYCSPCFQMFKGSASMTKGYQIECNGGEKCRPGKCHEAKILNKFHVVDTHIINGRKTPKPKLSETVD